MSFGARAIIRLAALGHNFSVIKQQAAVAAIMAVVKANAYGHGLAEVAGALPEADSFAVARLSEVAVLRNAGIQQPIVLLSGVYSADDLRQAAAAGCEVVVHCESQIELLETHKEQSLIVWLKLDTGMHRLGLPLAQAASSIQRLDACPAVKELRLMSHLANSDNIDDPTTDTQLQQFATVARTFNGDISIANSGGIFGWPQSIRPDYLQPTSRLWVRPGIALYGISPYPDKNGSELGLKPVMQFESRLVAVKRAVCGDRVGYGGTWKAERDTTLGIISAGYGDGYTHYLPAGTPVLVNGRMAGLAGAVSMDLAAIDLGPDATDKVGDLVVLWGDELPVEEIARRAGAHAYQLVCGVMNREASSIVD